MTSLDCTITWIEFIIFIINCQHANVSFCVTFVSVEVDKITLDIAKIPRS